MQIEEMRLDGNAAGGVLRQVYARDVTGALATCARCHAQGPVGTLLEYGHGMGVVLRCPHCDALMLRVVQARGWVRVDATGIGLLMIPEESPPS